MRLSTSVKTALAIFAVVAVYFGVRTIFAPGKTSAVDPVAPPAFTVIADEVAPAEWRDEITVSGRTRALRKVVLRAETSGVVARTPVTPGTFVKEGEVLCALRVDARAAALAEARAALAKAEIDHRAAVELAKEGFRSEAAVAAAKAARDLAAANVEAAQVNLQRTSIAAPFDGVFDQRNAETGDFLNVGDACGLVIAPEPFLVVGSLAERDVAKISPGDRGVARLATGERVEGRVRSVARSADERTRTFDVELETPNPDGALRDGVTAEFTIYAARREAHRIPRSALTLDDSGVMGVRTVDAEGRVAFSQVAILGETPQGLWVSGLDGVVRLIVRGQEYVRPGQKVDIAEGRAG